MLQAEREVRTCSFDAEHVAGNRDLFTIGDPHDRSRFVAHSQDFPVRLDSPRRSFGADDDISRSSVEHVDVMQVPRGHRHHQGGDDFFGAISNASAMVVIEFGLRNDSENFSKGEVVGGHLRMASMSFSLGIFNFLYAIKLNCQVVEKWV